MTLQKCPQQQLKNQKDQGMTKTHRANKENIVVNNKK